LLVEPVNHPHRFWVPQSNPIIIYFQPDFFLIVQVFKVLSVSNPRRFLKMQCRMLWQAREETLKTKFQIHLDTSFKMSF
jgi:hypothetical protein